jgi:ornithine cyclodeaminase/alanine dehydrogenase-like protein (mu-crystallin family)
VSVLFLSERDVNELLTMPECIDAMHRLFASFSAESVVQPLRLVAWQPDRRGGIAAMPAFVGTADAIGAKLITVFPDNREAGLDSHQGIVSLHETRRGRLLGIFHAGAITAIRTAAVSAVATRMLAAEDAGTLAMLGSGTQARTHLEAMIAVRPISALRIWSRTPANADGFSRWASGRFEDLHVTTCDSAQAAVQGAEVICTVTAARAPILQGRWIAPGAHVNAAGASVPGFRELDADAVAGARLFVDSHESALAEADDIRTLITEGRIDASHIAGDLSALASGRIAGRRNAREITLFESCGMAAEDVASAALLYARALPAGRGTRVDF